MKNKSNLSARRLYCSLCGDSNASVSQCESGYVCESCADKTRTGRDNTSRAVKTLQTSLRGQAQKDRAQFTGGVIDESLEYDIASSRIFADESLEPRSAVMLVDGGEVLPEHARQFVDTLAVPGTHGMVGHGWTFRRPPQLQDNHSQEGLISSV